ANNATTLLRSSSGHLWTTLSGVWGISGNTGYLVSPTTADRSVSVVTAIANGRASMTVNSPLGARLAFRMSDKNNGYLVEATASTYLLKKLAVQGYAPTVLADNPVGYWRLGDASVSDGATLIDA